MSCCHLKSAHVSDAEASNEPNDHQEDEKRTYKERYGYKYLFRLPYVCLSTSLSVCLVPPAERTDDKYYLKSEFKYCRLSVYFMKAVFGQSLDSAVLLTPPARFNGSICVQFQYRLSHKNIILSVQTTGLYHHSLSEQKFIELIYRHQTNASDWNSANGQVYLTGDEMQQLAFVAEKIGVISGLEYAAIRNIVINRSLCPQPGNRTFFKTFLCSAVRFVLCVRMVYRYMKVTNSHHILNYV